MFSSTGNRRPSIAGLSCLMFLTILVGLASAQQFAPATAENAKQFAGTWKAQFQGKPFMTVKIGFKGDKLVGTVSHADIEVNDAGELTKAEANETADPDPITDAVVNGDLLRVTTKSEDGSGNGLQFDLKLVAKDEASLRLVVPPDVPGPKPWRLERVSAKP